MKNNKMIELKGSLFSSNCELLCHGVNCKGIMGAGIALQFKQKFPQMYKIYREKCFSFPHPEPGDVQICVDTTPQGKQSYIGNLFTQRELGSCAKLEYVQACVDELIVMNEGTDNCPGFWLKSVAFPRIGCGIGGLVWEDVKPVLQQLTKHFDRVEVWSL